MAQAHSVEMVVICTLIAPSAESQEHRQTVPALDRPPLTFHYSLCSHTSPEGSLPFISIEIWPHVPSPETTHFFPA